MPRSGEGREERCGGELGCASIGHTDRLRGSDRVCYRQKTGLV